MPPKPIPKLSALDMKRFWAKVIKTENCWLWQAATDDDGYGIFAIGIRNVKAHRVAYVIHTGIDPGTAPVIHTCNTRICVRPVHLSLGTHERTRARRIDSPSEAIEQEMLRLLRSGSMRQKEIAEAFGYSPSFISRLKRKHVHATDEDGGYQELSSCEHTCGSRGSVQS